MKESHRRRSTWSKVSSKGARPFWIRWPRHSEGTPWMASKRIDCLQTAKISRIPSCSQEKINPHKTLPTINIKEYSNFQSKSRPSNLKISSWVFRKYFMEFEKFDFEKRENLDAGGRPDLTKLYQALDNGLSRMETDISP